MNSQTTNVIDFLRGREKTANRRCFARLRSCVCWELPTKLSTAIPITLLVRKVKVTDGPFKDFHGVIEEVNTEETKLIVSIKIFERKTPLELENSQVERE